MLVISLGVLVNRVTPGRRGKEDKGSPLEIFIEFGRDWLQWSPFVRENLSRNNKSFFLYLLVGPFTILEGSVRPVIKPPFRDGILRTLSYSSLSSRPLVSPGTRSPGRVCTGAAPTDVRETSSRRGRRRAVRGGLVYPWVSRTPKERTNVGTRLIYSSVFLRRTTYFTGTWHIIYIDVVIPLITTTLIDSYILNVRNFLLESNRKFNKMHGA